MKNPNRVRPAWFCSVLLMVGILLAATRSFASSTTGGTVVPTWNLTLLDQIIAGVPAGEKYAQIDDQLLPVTYLRSWRSYLAGGMQANSAFAGGFTQWPGGNVYYAFDTSVTSAKQKVFTDSAAEWATFANLHFFLRSTQTDYILVTNNPSLSGGLSVVGMGGGAQLLQIGTNAWNHGTVVHEIGHALGLVHEHQRLDRDNYVTVVSNNVAPGELFNFVLLGTAQNKGPYDFLSVMHYRHNAFSVSPSIDTIVALPAYSQYQNIMGQQFDPVLSTNDRAGMISIYGAGPGASSVVTNTLDSGPGSLRAALYYAYDHPGTTITFNIPSTDPGYSNNVFNIIPSDKLTSPVNATILDGTTEPVKSNPNGPQILINGSGCIATNGVYANGLMLPGTNCTVRGLTINNFNEYGVLITGSNNTLAGCYLGVDPAGTSAVTNMFCPVHIGGGAIWNTVGGLAASNRNLLSGSPDQGITISDPGTSFNTVEGNYIGLNAAGTAALPNAWSGVEIYNSATGNTIGGTATGAGNVISGNKNYGVLFNSTGVNGNLVQGNIIGLNAAGTAIISNAYAGVCAYYGASSNLIGGAVAGARNIISGGANDGVQVLGASTGNVIAGNYIGLNLAGTAALGNTWSGVDLNYCSSNNVVTNNVISGNGHDAVQNHDGVLVLGSTVIGSQIAGNIIGLNAAGTAALPNTAAGVDIQVGAVGNTVSGNVISGNGGDGVLLYSSTTAGNAVTENYIGVNPAGTAALGNSGAGVDLQGGTVNNTVSGNLISGNYGDGVLILNSPTGGNVVSGNYIGLNAAGTAALANVGDGVDAQGGTLNNVVASNVISGNISIGVYIQGTFNSVWGNLIGLNAAGTAAVPNDSGGVAIYPPSSSNTIGGYTAAARNVISGNLQRGVLLYSSPVTQNLVVGNYIGLNAAGTAAVSNAWSGVEMFNGPVANVIGGPGGGRNFISGNGNYGVALDNIAIANVVQGNTIGLNATNGAAVPNGSGYANVVMYSGAVSNLIGGITPGTANLISGATAVGVLISGATTTNNTVRGNSIFSNASGAISLNGSGNHVLAAPTLSAAVVTTNTTVTGTYNGTSGKVYLLDFYADAATGSSAEGMTYLGSRSFTGTGSSSAFTANLGALIPAGRAITASATDPAGDTSQLSTGVTVTMTSAHNDGISDAWRNYYFGTTATNATSDAFADPDHDGLNNLAEFLSGSNPTNAASVFKLSMPNPLSTTNAVAVDSANGIVYRVWYKDDLIAGTWNLLADQVQGTGTNVNLGDPGVTATAKRFYRAQVLW